MTDNGAPGPPPLPPPGPSPQGPPDDAAGSTVCPSAAVYGPAAGRVPSTANPQPGAVPAGGALEFTGGLYYGLGFLAFIPVPFLGLLVAAIVMAANYAGSRDKGALAAENGRRAANWGLTIIAVMILLAIWVVLLATVFTGSWWSTPAGPVITFLALSITHLVVVIMGVVEAGKRRVLRNVLAIPFLG